MTRRAVFYVAHKALGWYKGEDGPVAKPYHVWTRTIEDAKPLTKSQANALCLRFGSAGFDIVLIAQASEYHRLNFFKLCNFESQLAGPIHLDWTDAAIEYEGGKTNTASSLSMEEYSKAIDCFSEWYKRAHKPQA